MDTTINNPNGDAHLRTLAALAQAEAVEDRAPAKLAVRRYKYEDPDKQFDAMVHTLSTRLVEVDAKMMERRGRGYEQVHYRNLKEMMAAKPIRRRVLDVLSGTQLREINERLHSYVAGEKDLREARAKGKAAFDRLREAGKLSEASSSFYLGLYADEEQLYGTGSPRTVFSLQDTILPSTSSPQSKQQLFIDYLDMHRKCLAGDVRIALLDGTTPTIRELVERGPEAEFWVYACRDGMVYPALARSPRQTGVMQTFEVELDNGEVVRATGNHPFMLRDGSYRTVEDLRPGDSLMPLYRRLTRSNPKGYEEVLHPDLRLWETTHRLVARVTQPAHYLFGEWHHVDHVNERRSDNRPENIQLLTRSEHFKKTSARPDMRANAARLGNRVRSIEERRKLSQVQKRTWQDPVIRERRVAGLKRNNHRVVAVRPAWTEPVYDITVPGFSNFALASGVFVHNSWEAATRNPVGKRIVDIVPQFVLGRGVIGSTKHGQGQDAWNDFWAYNKMRQRTRLLLRELLIYGEVFLRYFKQRNGLAVRSLDPSTIWDIVTNPDDIEDVKYYHQQYTILNTSPVPWVSTSMYPGTLIIRQIPAKDIDHFKINATSSEKRGRSQLYAILGWLLRFKEFANDRVLLNKMRAMFALDVAVKGDAADVASAEAQFATPPGPGAVLVHNDAVTVDYKNANNNANEAKTDAEMILKIIAIGAGVSQQFLGVTDSATRAGALIQTEPDVKNFEMYQEVVEDMLLAAWDRVKVVRNVRPSTIMEFTFPALAQEDRSAKLKDIAFSEAMDYFSKERSATMAAREFNITTYDFTAEQAKIQKERGKEPVMATGMQQVAKIAPDPAALPEEPGLGGDLAPGAEPETPEQPPPGFTPDKGPVTQTSGQMGFSAKSLSGRGMANTKATLNRPAFQRGKEKQKIKTNRSEGTPLRATVLPEPYGIRLMEKAGPFTYSSTQVNLPPDVAAKVKALAATIPDRVLAEDGREDQPHVTIKYGLHGTDPAAVAPILAKQPPVALVLGETKVFETEEHDVVYVEVASPGLGKLHKALSGALPNTDTHPTYRPHVTVAYVKKGEGARYAGDAVLAGTKVVAREVLFSAKDGAKTNLPLGKPRHVWTKEARAKALLVRRQNALKRRQE